ncbi:MAG: SDR family NAD(P)-dependent oxidoreductase, partial [Archangium sp.]|nr:SDR family NAD(P)-dependent oxidoreductase [Archangium sp.]
MASFSGVRRTDLELARAPVQSLDLSGKTAAVVGGTGGIGRAIARLLAERGATVTVVGQTFRDHGVARVSFLKADLNLMR